MTRGPRGGLGNAAGVTGGVWRARGRTDQRALWGAGYSLPVPLERAGQKRAVAGGWTGRRRGGVCDNEQVTFISFFTTS